jgi:hypothetical protein
METSGSDARYLYPHRVAGGNRRRMLSTLKNRLVYNARCPPSLIEVNAPTEET